MGVLVVLITLLPLFSAFASQEVDSKEIKKSNLVDIFEDILENSTYLLEKNPVYRLKVDDFSTERAVATVIKGNALDILVTGYSSTPDQCWGNPFITASGARVHEGTMACPPEYVFGTKVEVEGMGTYVCEDRGGKIKGNHFDMWFTSRGEALAWGKRTVEAKIMEI